MKSLIITHLFAAIIITAILLTVYACVQQAHRSSANDPQLQMARDISSDLKNGKPITKFLTDTINLQESLAAFIEIFDATGKPVQSTGFINGNLPQPPNGVFEFTNAKAEDVLTWQPQADVRLAMVFEKINSAGKGFVAVGRSLKETEMRESNLIKMVGIAWIGCLFAVLLHLFIQSWYFKRSAK